jgi:hypothetical protein
MMNSLKHRVLNKIQESRPTPPDSNPSRLTLLSTWPIQK